jgi:hypothetical protein
MSHVISIHRGILLCLAAAIPGSTSLLASDNVARGTLAHAAPAHITARRAALRVSPSSAHEQPVAALRTADASHSAALFAGHSWFVPPPPPPPVAPPPPPPPTAPPFPYTFVGSYAPAGSAAVYFLSRSDRVVDAHVGDHLDGVYVFESAGPDGLIFNYLPLNIRQTLSTGVSP